MCYLEPVETKTYFAKLPECLPFMDCIDDFIEITESLMDEWIGYHMCVKEYCEKRTTNWQGEIVLWQYPVVEILSVVSVVSGGVAIPVSSVFDGKNTLSTGNCDCSRSTYVIKYIAGEETPPAIAKHVGRSILAELLKTGNLVSLYESPKQIEEVQNPSVGGSFKQRFKRDSTGAKTLLDLLMTPMKRYRRTTHN